MYAIFDVLKVHNLYFVWAFLLIFAQICLLSMFLYVYEKIVEHNYEGRYFILSWIFSIVFVFLIFVEIPYFFSLFPIWLTSVLIILVEIPLMVNICTSLHDLTFGSTVWSNNCWINCLIQWMGWHLDCVNTMSGSVQSLVPTSWMNHQAFQIHLIPWSNSWILQMLIQLLVQQLVPTWIDYANEVL